jgi:bisanhydrobacterioruberin hydratase
MRVVSGVSGLTQRPPASLKAVSVIVDGATIALFFDWVMEPVAMKLGFWQWMPEFEVPWFNYASWFVVSMVMLGMFHYLDFGKRNIFAIHLLLIQWMFFLLLRTFL